LTAANHVIACGWSFYDVICVVLGWEIIDVMLNCFCMIRYMLFCWLNMLS